MEGATVGPVLDSPPVRTVTILGSFLRGRPRGISTSTSHIDQQQLSPRSPSTLLTVLPVAQQGQRSPPGQPPSSSVELPGPTPPAAPRNHRRRSLIAGSVTIPSHSPQPAQAQSGPSLGLTNILRRRRSAGNVNTNSSQPVVPAPQAQVQLQGQPSTSAPAPQPPMLQLPASASAQAARSPSSTPLSGSHRIRLVPHLDSRRTLRFEPIARDLRDGDPPLRIGRFTDRSGIGLAAANALSSNKLAFKSKVVSRAHAEIWASDGGKFFIKDTKSSSGTFLNHLRLSPAGTESRPHQLKDGDILQLGVDYQGGTEDIYKSVKIRIEIGREWQSGANAFNTNALTQLRSLAVHTNADQPAGGKRRAPKTNIPDCCICLFAVTIRQALFIAPCSHTFHYKCIRPLLEQHHSAFSCPLCRTFADLEEDVEVEIEADEEDEQEDDDEGLVNPPASAPPTASSMPIRSSSKHLNIPTPVKDGAETEVEPDQPRASRRPHITLHTGSAGEMNEEMFEDEDDILSPTSAVALPGPGFVLAPPVSGGDSSEGEGSGSGEGHMEGVEGVTTVSGKRKR